MRDTQWLQGAVCVRVCVSEVLYEPWPIRLQVSCLAPDFCLLFPDLEGAKQPAYPTKSTAGERRVVPWLVCHFWVLYTTIQLNLRFHCVIVTPY